jgi:hypothetical protein
MNNTTNARRSLADSMKSAKFLASLALFAVVFLSLVSFNDSENGDDGLLGVNDHLSELTKAYATQSFYTSHGNYFTLTELPTDELAIPVRGLAWFDGGVNLRFHRQQYLPADFFINDTWQAIYRGIVTTNKQLYQYSKITDPTKDIYRAELKVLRAWYHYLLLDLFGKAPILAEYFPSSPGLPAAATSTQLYNFVESEITTALPDLSASPVYGRFCQSGAKAILSKLYLNANTYIGVDKTVEAEAEIDDIMNTGDYSLPSDYFDAFYSNNDNSLDIIFQIPYDQVTLQGFNMIVMTLHYESQKTFNLSVQPWNGYAAIEDFYNSFEAGDERLGQFMTGTQRDTTLQIPLVDPTDDFDPDGPVIRFTPFINDLDNTFEQSGARIHKWKYQLGATEQMNNDFAIFRYADVVLMKAECRLRLGDEPGALSFINMVRVRADVSPFSSLTLSDILAERGREMFAEAWRRQDLIRFGQFNNAWWEKSATSSYVNIYPIPQAQLDGNFNLTQNPGY